MNRSPKSLNYSVRWVALVLMPTFSPLRLTCGFASTILAVAVFLVGANIANAAPVTIADGTNPWTDTSGLDDVTLAGSATLGADNIVNTLTFSPTAGGKSLSKGSFSSVTILSNTLNLMPNSPPNAANNQIYNASGVDVKFGALGTNKAVINQGTGTLNGIGKLYANDADFNLSGFTFTGGMNLGGDQSATLLGTLTLNSGNLRIIGAGAKLSASSNLVINNSATFVLHDSANITLATMTLNDGGLSEGGTGTKSLTANSFALKKGTIGTGVNLAGAGSTLTKSSTNAVALASVNTYTGATAVTSGTLLLSGAGSINSTSGASVSAGATFTNNSSVAYNQNLTLVEGVGAAGAVISGTGAFTASSLTINSDLSDGFTSFALGTTAFAKAGNLELTLSGIAPGSYSLFSGSALSGAFGTMSIGGFSLASLGGGDFSGLVGASNYTFTNSSNLLNVSAVPEPSSCVLLAVGLTVGVVLRRRPRLTHPQSN